MGYPVKILLIDPENDNYGNGLAAIRTRESELIDITGFEDALSDATSVGGLNAHFIKDNRGYGIIKNYFDYDKKRRVYIAKYESERYNEYPLPDDYH